MTIKYRAVHARNSWRKVNIHRSLDSAINGNDGAKNLLLRKGRVGKKWEDYGAVDCVFVWEAGSSQGTALRLQPGSTTDVQTATIPVHKLEEWDRKGGCSDREIDGCFR
jgi:hypothetical protein